jgi:hypothetical protein
VPPTSSAFAGRKQNPSLHAVGLPTLAKTAQEPALILPKP